MFSKAVALKILVLFHLKWVDSLGFELSGEGRRLSSEENRRLNETCGKPQDSSSAFRVLYGSQLHQGEAPWVVGITRTNSIWYPEMSEQMMEKEQSLLCSGSLISSRHVITAGRCIKVISALCPPNSPFPHAVAFGHRNLDRLRIYLGGSCSDPASCKASKRDEQIVGRKVHKVYLPYHFTMGSCDQLGDVAIFELDEDVPFSTNIYPICLAGSPIAPKNASDAEKELHMAGFGIDPAQDPEYGADRAVLKSEKTKEADCEGNTYASEDTFCTRAELGGACAGDTGSGVYRTRSNRRELVGVHKAGEKCEEADVKQRMGRLNTEKNKPKVETAVLFHLHWICQVTGICPRQEDIEAVAHLAQLPPTSRPRWAIELGAIPYNQMFVM